MKIEFEELQKIWDTQNNKPIYVMNDQVLHSHILLKQNQAGRIANVSELVIIITNASSGLVVFWLTSTSAHPNIYMYLLSLWMILSAIYTWSLRHKRQSGNNSFDKTLLGDLQLAQSITSYQVRFSQIMRWNILPVGGFVLLGLSTAGKPMWITAITVLAFAISYLGGIWEHSIYRRRNEDLKALLVRLNAD